MFEYLMPTLFLKSYEQTFLTQSCRSAVDDQIAYASIEKRALGNLQVLVLCFRQQHDLSIPCLWRARAGIQARSGRRFSHHALCFPAGLAAASAGRPPEHGSLDAIHMRGLYGYYEAVDYTPSRMPLRQDHAIIRSYMAHHQGMILTSLTQLLC